MHTKKVTLTIENPRPLNAGAILPKTFVGPSDEYCPNANSIKNNGNPAKSNIITYGTRKLPPPLV